LESDSDGDETASDTEETAETTEAEEQIVPVSEDGNFSSESASTDGVGTNDAVSGNIAVNGTAIIIENVQKSQHLKQQAAPVRTRPPATRVLQRLTTQLTGDKMCAASLRSAANETTSLTSSAGGSDGVRINTASTCAITSGLVDSRKPVVVSLPSQFSKSSVCEPQARSSVAQANSASLTMSTASSVNSRRVVPVLCGIMSSSAAQEPAACVVVKVEPESSEELVESDFNEQSTEPELKEQSTLNRTFTVSAGKKSSALLLGKASSLSSASTHRNSSNSMTAAGPFVSEASTNPCVNRSVTDSVAVAGPCTSEAFTSCGISKPVANSVTAAKPCISKALANYDVSKPVTAIGSSVSEALTNPRVSKSSRWSSIDVKPSLGKSVVIANLAMPITNDKLPPRAVAPTSQRDIVQMCNRLRQMRYRDSYRPPSKQVESECFQRQSAVSELVSRVQQGVAKKSVSAVMGGPVVSTARAVSSVADFQPAESHGADPSCSKVLGVAKEQQGVGKKSVSALIGGPVVSTAHAVSSVANFQPAESHGADPNCSKVPCGNRPTNATAHEPVASAVMTKSSQISAGCTAITARRGYCAPVVNNGLKESGGENRLSRCSNIDGNNNNRAGNRCTFETRLANVITDGEKADQKSSQRQFGRFATSSPPPVHPGISDTMLASVVRDNSKVDKNLSQRRFRGFATSTPLRDSCPPPDMSFGSLSTISLASDQEEYDSAEISDESTESDDDVVLLDVAFNSDNNSALWSSETCACTVELEPLRLSSKTDSFTVRESSRANTVKLKPPDLSRKTVSSAVCAPSYSSSWITVSTSNCTTSQSCGFANLRCRAKLGSAKRSNAVGPVVHHVSTKRTRCEVLSSSSDSDDGMLKTRHSVRTLRSTCARWS